MPEPIAVFNIGAADQVYNQTNEFIYYVRGNANQNANEADPFGGICDAHEGYETAEVRNVRRTGGGRNVSRLNILLQRKLGPDYDMK